MTIAKGTQCRLPVLTASAACATLLFSSAAAHADPLDPPRAYNQVAVDPSTTYYQNITNSDLSTSVEVFGRYGGYASVVAYAPTTSLTAISSAPLTMNGQQNAEPTAQASETYYYTAIGSTGPVPVDIRYTVEIETAGQAEATSSISVVDDFGYSYSPQYFDYVRSDTNPIPYSAYSQSHQNYVLNTIATPGQENQLTLDISTSADGYLSPTAAYAYAHADPYIYIDPAFLAAHPGVGLEISDGIGNVNPVPEPSSWALLLGGLGLVGAVRRRRSS